MSKSFITNNENKSRFYYEHYIHDMRESMDKPPTIASTHSGEIGKCLRDMIKSVEDKNMISDMEKAVLDIKFKFYDQFVD